MLGSKVTEVYIGPTVVNLTQRQRMGWGCDTVTTVTIDVESYTSIGGYMMGDCPNLKTINLNWENIVSIADTAFQNNSAWSQTIDLKSCTTVGASAFYGCSSLTLTVYANILTSYNQENSFSGVGTFNYIK